MRYVNGKFVQLNEEEMDALEAERANSASQPPSTEERLAALEAAMLAMLGGASDV